MFDSIKLNDKVEYLVRLGVGIRTRREEYRLKNGLRVVLASDFDYPTIDIRMVFPV